jgi:16S rRNA (cytidine1402-2'-O)-methyltransferase
MLYVVATPIGDVQEISLRALNILRAADLIICESTKETSKLLKSHEIKAQRYEVLNEHSTPEDIQALGRLCQEKTVALVSDCGTPSFCDPGFQMVDYCRRKNIPVKAALGPSSLMGLLALSSEQIKEFHFRGFLPAENVARENQWKILAKEKNAIIVMDTPYRLKKTVAELATYFPQRKILLTLNISQGEEEQTIETTGSQIASALRHEKAEFMALIYAEKANP